MKVIYLVVAVSAMILEDAFAQQALFVKNDYLSKGHRVTRQTTNADQMVQNILQWLQGVYTQNSRKIRQGTLREYLPPSNTQKPRPFEPVSPITQTPTTGNQGYPPSGITPQPSFPIYTNQPGGITGDGYPSPGNEISPPHEGYPSSPQPQPPFTDGGPSTGFPSTGYPTTSQKPGFPTGYPTQKPGFPTGYPTPQPSQPPSEGYPTQKPGFPTGYPTQKPGFPTGYPTQKPGFPTGYPTQQPTEGYPTQKPGFPTGYPTQQPTEGYPTQKPGFPTGYPTQKPTDGTPAQPEYTTGYPTQKPGFPSQPPVISTQPQPDYTTGYPTQKPSPTLPPITSGPIYTEGPSSQSPITSAPAGTTQAPTPTEDNNIEPTVKPEPSDINGVTSVVPTDEDLKHPPHIHAIDVECAKDMMTISIEFNREFNGVIYSKDHYSQPECRYVNENSEQTKYKFTVSLNSCGTEFINAFDTQGQSYLENVLVIQNEIGIQEVWDTVRSVRCLWEGNLKDSLSVALSVGMLSQEIVTFSGDTAMARLDIQLGKGPFAPPANGLVKIGETMTLVISVSGDPGFDIQVKDCRATDSTGDRVYPLTDDNGCVLKPKLFGAFQKTRNTGNTGASIIAFAFFNAFKFPDVMDLMIQCNIELCKTDCEVCPADNQKIEPGRRRRRRDLYSYNETLADGVTMGKHLRVVLAEDLSDLGTNVLNVHEMEGVCMSTQNFVFSSAILISLLTASCFISASLWLKNQRLNFKV